MPLPPVAEPPAAGAPPGEGSFIGRFVAIITPLIAVAAGWLSGLVADNVPGVSLDKGEIVAFMVAVSTAVLTSAWKWLEGLQKHEERVAAGKEVPIKLPKLPA
jgi:hypothetical protein